MRLNPILTLILFFMFGLNLILPVLTKQEPVIAPTAVDSTPFTYVEPTGIGTFGYYKVNIPYFRNWLNNTIFWEVQKSLDGKTWVDYKDFEVKKQWNEKDSTEKQTIIVTSNEDAYYRILSLTDPNQNIVSYADKSVLDIKNGSKATPLSDEIVMDFQVTKDYTYRVFFNWSDYTKSDTAMFSSFSKSITAVGDTNIFSWKTTSLLKIRQGEQFILDPVVGDITAGIVSSYEWDSNTGRLNGVDSIVRVNSSEYYLIVYAGIDNDGWARTIQVWDSNGTIKSASVSSYEFDTSDGFSVAVDHISGSDKYVIVYSDRGSSALRLITLQVWDTNGTIRNSVIDTQALTNGGEFTSLLSLTNNVWGVTYSDYWVSQDGFLETWWIDTNGIINNTQLDIEEFDAVSSYYTWMCLVDSNTLAITYEMVGTGGDYCLMTYNFTTAGLITDTPADSWQYEGNPYSRSFINKVGSTKFALTYVDNTDDIYCKTVTIADSGDITASFVDTLTVVTASEIEYFSLPFFVADPNIYGSGVMGVTTYGVGAGEADGYIYTWNISDAGALDASITDSYEFETAEVGEQQNVMYIAGNYYLIVFTGAGSDGWAKTIEIETPSANDPPSVVASYPLNGATGISVNIAIHNITISDPDGDHMDYDYRYFMEGCNLSGSSGASVLDGTYTLILNAGACCPLEFSTVYHWWVNVTDGAGGWDNETFSFTTEPRQWKNVEAGGWFRFSNVSATQTLETGWFLFSNISTEKTATTGWFRFQNTSIEQSQTTGWFRFSNASSDVTLSSGWFRFSNSSSVKTLTSGWFRFSNLSSEQTVTSGWFRFQNVSHEQTITSGWFRFQNVSSDKTVTSGWFRFLNVSHEQTATSGWFSFRNISSMKTITSGWFRFANAIGIPCFTYTVEGAIIHLHSCSYTIFNSTIDGYLWEFSIDDGQTYSNTGWINDSSGADYDYTYRDDGYVYVRLSCFVGNTTNISAPAERIIELGNNLDVYPPSYYILCQDCLDAGYYWWDNSCHLTDEPLPWNEDRPLPDAGQPEPYTFKIGEWTVTPWQMLLVAGGIIVFLYLRHKQRKKIKKEIDKKWVENVEKK